MAITRSFAVFNRSEPEPGAGGRWGETLVVHWTGREGKEFRVIYARITNGGRGLSNAWTRVPYGAVSLNDTLSAQLRGRAGTAICIDPIIVALTSLDINSLDAEDLPRSLSTRVIARAESAAPVSTSGSDTPTLAQATLMAHAFDAAEIPSARRSPSPSPAAPTVTTTVAAAESEPVPAPSYESGYYEVKRGVVVLPTGVEYHTRKVEGVEDVLMIRTCRRAESPVFLYGPPGTGKTKAIEAAFNDCETLLGTSDTEVADFIGQYVQTVDEHGVIAYPWIDGPLIRAMERGVPLFIDEIGLIDPKVLSTVYSVMDGRGELYVTANPLRGTIKAHPGFYVCAATNPDAPGVRLSEALLSRFAVHVEVTTDFGMAGRLGVDARLVTAAANLDTKRRNGEVSWAPQMRELLAAKKTLGLFGQNFALRNLVSIAPEDSRDVVAEVLTKAFGVSLDASGLYADR